MDSLWCVIKFISQTMTIQLVGSITAARLMGSKMTARLVGSSMRHYKGGIYRVVGVATCTETADRNLVIYTNDKPTTMGCEWWARDEAEFLGVVVNHRGHIVWRFVQCDDDDDDDVAAQ